MTFVKKINNFKAKWGTLVYGEDCDFLVHSRLCTILNQ
jgi:hypothetical protein